jgi:ribosome-binding protein aMBF1 (putative translation factor)
MHEVGRTPPQSKKDANAMPQRTTSTEPAPVPGERLLERIATALRVARARTGLSEQQVVALLAQQGLAITVETLRRWETSGLVHVDSASHLADAYGATLDSLAGRRAFSRRHAANDQAPSPRSSW